MLTAENRLEYMQTLILLGIALAIVFGTSLKEDEFDGSNRLVVSIDTTHKPGSTTEEREDASQNLNPFQSYIFQNGKMVQDGTFQLAIAKQDEGEANGSGAPGRLTNLLYSLENLRKREGDMREE